MIIFSRYVVALLIVFAVPNIAKSDSLLGIDWNGANNSTYTGGGTLNGRTVSISRVDTYSTANTGRVYNAQWTTMFGSSYDLDTSRNYGFSYAVQTSGSVTTLSFSSAITDPYVMFTYADFNSVDYDFSGNGPGSVASIVASAGSGSATLSGDVVTASGYGNSGLDGFVVKLSGTFTSITLNATSTGSNDTGVVSVALDGYAVSTTIGANGSASVLGDTLLTGNHTQVVEATGTETLTYTITPATNYRLDTANSTSSCGGTLAASYITSAIAADCSISVAFIETVSPTFSSSTPADGATGVAVGSNIVLTFSETIQAGTGNITLYDSSDNVVEAFDVTTDVTFAGATVTLNPASDLSSLTGYYIQVAASAIDDLAGNSFAGISDKTTLNFTSADTVVPTLTSSTPTDDATGVAITDNIVLTFSENVQAGSGNIVISDGASDTRTIAIGDAQVSISGATVTINPTADLNSSTSYYVQVASTAIEDTSGNAYAGISNTTTLNFTTADTVVPTLTSSTPTDDATGVAITDNIVLTFSENVQAGSGNIVISDGASDTRTIAIGDAQVSISGATVTINPTADLNSSTSYYVQVASTAIEDTSGNAYAGISNTTTLNFTTADVIAPTAVFDPVNGGVNVAVDANITITFSEAIRLLNDSALDNTSVDALVTLKDSNSSGANIAFDATISGNVITINPSNDFSLSQQVYVSLGATVEDTSDNAYSGGAATFTVTANISTPATEFADHEATIRRQIQTVALQSIRNSVQEATDFMILARERFRVCRVNGSGAKSSICGINVPFDIDGSTSISTSSANIGGSFFGQLGNFDGTYRRMTSGDFNIQRDAEGNTTGALSGRIAWEYLSDNSMLGWFVGAEYAQSDFAGTFTGEQNSFGASIGGYFVSEVQDQLFLDGHLTFRQSEHELQLSNGTLDLESVYHSSTILTGLTLTGVSAINDDAEVSPTLSFNAARTDLGTIGFTGVAYGLTDSTLSMDGGAVSYADISFAPKYRVAMDGQSLPSSLLVATVAPRAMCEYVELTGSTTRSCGSGLSLGLLGTAANGNGSLEFEMALDKVGGQLRHSIGLNASLQY